MAKKYSQKMRKTPTHTRERTQEAKNVAKNKKNKCLRKKKGGETRKKYSQKIKGGGGLGARKPMNYTENIKKQKR